MGMNIKDCLDYWTDLCHQYCSEEISKFLEDEEWIKIPDYAKLYLSPVKSPISVSQAISLFIKHGYEVNAIWDISSYKWIGYIGELERTNQCDFELTDKYDNYFEAVKAAMKLFIDNVRKNG